MSSLSPLSNDDDKKHFAETQHVERTMSVDTDCDTIKTGGDSKHLANLPTIIEGKTGDAAVELLQGERVVLTDEQSRMICRKIDKVILPILAWVYFLQILDKSVVGYGATFGMREDANLVGNQYSLIGSAGYWAQLAWQPFSALLIIKVPTRILMTATVVCWGIATCGMAASTSFNGIIASRFFLGLFEASCLPLFSLITVTWYRRSEQPLRVGIWYCTNGIANMLGSLLAYGVSFIKSDVLHVYQILFLIVGLGTVLTGPLIYWRIDNNPGVARFLTPEERKWAVERLRDNNTGVESKNIKWKQIMEAMLSPAVWLLVALTFCVNVGASVTNVFGPLILSGFGFTSRPTILLNIPFGFVQVCVIVLVSWLALRFRIKSVFLALLCIPCIVGAGLLYGLGREKKDTGPLLFGYYLIAFLFGANPLLVSWLTSNVAGYTKKSTVMAMYAVGNAVGNIVGPLLFESKDAPLYRNGLKAVLGIFVASGACTGLVCACFFLMNKNKEKQRVANGKPAKLTDRSMNLKYVAGVDDGTGSNAFLDLTDKENDEFIYVY